MNSYLIDAISENGSTIMVVVVALNPELAAKALGEKYPRYKVNNEFGSGIQLAPENSVYLLDDRAGC